MSTAFAESAAGREMLAGALRSGFTIPYSNVFMEMGRERWPCYVHYMGGEVWFTPPDKFCMRTPSGPSDCVWIAPGTTP